MGVLQTVVDDAVKRDVSGDGGTCKSAEQSSGGESLLKHFRAFSLFDLKHRQTGAPLLKEHLNCICFEALIPSECGLPAEEM